MKKGQVKRGRPPKQGNTMTRSLTIRFPEGLWAEVLAIQSARLDAPDAASIVRELVAEAITARKQREGSK